jgi:hypothetical protein
VWSDEGQRWNLHRQKRIGSKRPGLSSAADELKHVHSPFGDRRERCSDGIVSKWPSGRGIRFDRIVISAGRTRLKYRLPGSTRLAAYGRNEGAWQNRGRTPDGPVLANAQ